MNSYRLSIIAICAVGLNFAINVATVSATIKIVESEEVSTMTDPITKVKDEKFQYKNRSVVIRNSEGRVELVIDDRVYEVKFLQNGRPYTHEYVNVMTTSVRDYAERFIRFTIKQEAHWAEIRKQRKVEIEAQ